MQFWHLSKNLTSIPWVERSRLRVDAIQPRLHFDMACWRWLQCRHMALTLHFNTVDRVSEQNTEEDLWVNAAPAPDRHTRSLSSWFCLKQEEELRLHHWAVFSIHSGINWKWDNLLHQEQIEKFMWCKLSFIHVQICLCKTLWKQPQDVDMTFFCATAIKAFLLCLFIPATTTLNQMSRSSVRVYNV